MNSKDLKKPFFSIIIPTLDEEFRLPLLLKDLSLQSWTDFEVIHVDGGSTDKTLEKAKQWENKLNLKSIVHNIRGVSAQRNRGAGAANGEWIIFMDADNRLPSYFLVGIKYRIERAEGNSEKKFDIFSTFMHLNNEDKRYRKNRTAVGVINMFMRTTAGTNRPMVSGSMIGIRSQIFNKIKFDEKIKVSEDSNFVKHCVMSGWKYTILRNPTYAFSMRRIEHNGIVKTAASSFVMNLRYLFGDGTNHGDSGYEMLGGGIYRKK